MPDIQGSDPKTNPLGSPFDDPADPEALGAGQPGVTIFALLKLIALQLVLLNSDPGK